jgi:hypothetical protein
LDLNGQKLAVREDFLDCFRVNFGGLDGDGELDADLEGEGGREGGREGGSGELVCRR